MLNAAAITETVEATAKEAVIRICFYDLKTIQAVISEDELEGLAGRIFGLSPSMVPLHLHTEDTKP